MSALQKSRKILVVCVTLLVKILVSVVPCIYDDNQVALRTVNYVMHSAQ